jgi:hypothetical protein
MSAPERRKSRFAAFLQTTTGMVTAVATLIAAIAGLATAVTQLRGGSDSSPEASAVTTVVSGDTSAERELRAHVPTAIRATCGAPRYPEENAVAAFNCTYREIVGLQYNLFASDADLEQGITRVQSRYGSRHECGTKPLLCFVKDGTASIVWTEDPDILAFAWRDDGNLDALYESWSKSIAS